MAQLTFTIKNTGIIQTAIEVSKVFDEKGGTIGRNRDNDWILMDPHVSSRHAVVVFSNGTFLLEDLSRNGIFFDGSGSRIKQGVRHPLNAVRMMKIGPFDIEITPSLKPIVSGAGAGAGAGAIASASADTFFGSGNERGDAFSRPLANDDFAGLSANPADGKNDLPSALEDNLPVSNPLDLLLGNGAQPANGFADRVAPLRPSLPEQNNGRNYIDEPFHIDRPPASSWDEPEALSGIPEDWDKTGFTFKTGSKSPNKAVAAASPVKPMAKPSATPEQAAKDPAEDRIPVVQTPVQVHQQTPPRQDIPVLQDIQRQAGTQSYPRATAAFTRARLDPGLVGPALADQWLAILPIMLAGVLQLLQARETIKNELRVDRTMLQSSKNNPLKFSVSVEDALNNLFIQPRAGFKPAEGAFTEAISDLTLHQTALFHGLQATMMKLLEKLSPERIQTRAEQSPKAKNVFGKVSDTVKWQTFQALHASLAETSNQAFLDNMGADFVYAYEEFIRQNKES
jgi:type VI secretion system protein